MAWFVVGRFHKQFVADVLGFQIELVLDILVLFGFFPKFWANFSYFLVTPACATGREKMVNNVIANQNFRLQNSPRMR